MDLPRPVLVLLLARTVNQLGAFSIAFLPALLATDVRSGLASAGLVAGAFGLASVPSRLLGGRLADSLGSHRTIVLGLTGSAVAQLGLASAHSLAAAAFWAVVLGLVFELYEPPSQGLLADLAGPERRVRVFSLFNAALALGGMGAGLLAALLGRFDLRWLFVADAASCLTCAALVALAVPRDRPADGAARGDGDGPGGGARPWRDRRLLAMLALGTGYALLHMGIASLLPLALPERGLHSADAGLLFTVSAATVVCAQPLLRIRRLAALPTRVALAAGHVLLACGLAGYAVTSDLGGAAAATVLCGLGELLVMGRAYALAADLAPPGGTARYLAVFGTCWGFAAFAAPPLGTQLLARSDATTLWSVLAALALVLAAAQTLAPRPEHLLSPGRNAGLAVSPVRGNDIP